MDRTQKDKPTDAKPRQPRTIRLLNWAGGLLEQLGLNLIHPSEEELINAAIRKTGLTDFGDDEFKIPLRIMIEAAKKDLTMKLFNRIIFYGSVEGFLINRLIIQNEFNRHPEILQEKIIKPLFIISFPRTGTTLLHILLAQDPSNRALLYYESRQPALLKKFHAGATDPRIKDAQKYLERLDFLAPSLATMHSVGPEDPEECISLFYNSFISPFFAAFGNFPEYVDWFLKQDMISSYRYYRKQLQLLQYHHSANRWLLKTPMHLRFLEALLTVFPDACIVQTHRDPLKVLPSMCSLGAAYTTLMRDTVDFPLVGSQNLQIANTALNKGMATRDASNPEQFCDILYKDLVKNPIESVKKIYGYFGFDYTREFEERMKAWIAQNPKNKHGVHRYSLEQFGLTADEVNNQFAQYIERFGITKE